MNPYEVHDLREAALQEIAEGVYQEGIVVRIADEDRGPDLSEGQIDADGDGIFAREEPQFIEPEDEDVVTIRFGRGVSHERLGRVLRKCAEMFDGPHGCELANLGNEEGKSYSAYRLPDGELYFCKSADDYMQYLRMLISSKQSAVDIPAVIK